MAHSSARQLTQPPVDPAASQRQWPWVALTLLLITAVPTLGSIYWVRRNVVMVGHDATSYLETSIKYTRFFTDLSVQHLFQAFTFPDYRTPAIFMATQPFLYLFGIDMDGAQALNLALLPVVILATYALGRCVVDGRTGLIAAAIVAFLPLMAAMARLYYVEILLTAATTVNLWALYRSDHFRRRGWSLIWGASVGIGLLIKWTFPMYVLLPAAWVLWRSDLMHAQLAWLRRPHLNGRRLAASTAIGFGIALLWYWPNRDAAQAFLLGDWLLVGWTLLTSLTVYAIWQRGSLLSNWWVAVLLATVLASLWYLPYIDFPLKLLAIDRVRAPEGASPLHSSNYTRYFGFFYREHLGALAFWLLIPAGLFPWVRAWTRRASLQPRALLLWLSVLSAYVVLSLILQHNARNLVPLLPQIAVLLSIGLLAYARRTAQVIGAIWLTVLIGQWALFTFQPLSPLFFASRALWVSSDYVVPPAAATTDPGYWIAPDVLATIGESDGEPDSLGILVESWEVHRGIFRYLATRDARNLTIAALTEDDSRGWSDVLANRWLLVKDGDNSHVAAPGQAVLARIASPDPLFAQLYAPVEAYPLPNGETVTLFRRDAGPRQPLDYPVVLIETAGIADAVNNLLGPQATLIFSSPDTAAWVGIHDLHTADLPPDQVVVAENLAQVAAAVAAATGPVLVVTRYDTVEVRDALAARGYLAAEIGDNEFHLTVIGRPQVTLTPLPVVSTWDAVQVETLQSVSPVDAGRVLPIDALLTGRTDGSLKISFRLISPAGETVAQRDVTAEPAIALGLMIPPDTSAGTYTLAGVLYAAANGEALPDGQGNQVSPLTTIEVVGP